MKASAGRKRILLSFLAAIVSSALLTGCQTSIGGQTLPSATYLDDDVNFYPAGPEFKLRNQVEAARKYKLEQQQLRAGGGDGDAAGGAVGGVF